MFGLDFAGINTTSYVDWANITGSLDASNADVVMPYNATITASYTNTSSGALYYIKNGAAPVSYSVPFTVATGDRLHWEAQTKGTFSSVASIYIGTALIDTFTITLS